MEPPRDENHRPICQPSCVGNSRYPADTPRRLQVYDPAGTSGVSRADKAVISVTTAYPGADAELVQGFITTPLQRAISEAADIDYLISDSKQGVSIISANMNLNIDPNVAIAEIQAKVASHAALCHVRP
ncbi:MAG: efflux RND transporter permease subunit [Candidatus Azotimanducaceae bacterium WSBS_2022_MAG_OTU7]